METPFRLALLLISQKLREVYESGTTSCTVVLKMHEGTAFLKTSTNFVDST